MKYIQSTLQDTLFSVGLFLLAISLVFFNLPYMIHVDENDFAIFIPNFVLTSVYFFILLFSGRLKAGRGGLYPFFIFLILFLISAYSLNRVMSIFDSSVPWFMVLLVTICVNYILFAFMEALPEWMHYMMFFLLGISMLVFLYLSIYLLSLYVLSAAIFFVLGISLHCFVPLLFCIYTIVLLKRRTAGKMNYRISFFAGLSIAIIFIVVFAVNWANAVHEMNRNYQAAVLENKENLPAWISVARKMPQSYITERILKTDLVYSVPRNPWSDMFWRMPTRNFGEKIQHDPLITLSFLLVGEIKIPVEERVKILECMYDARHQALDRLWSGDDLQTSQVQTDVKIWPASYLAYTEKFITVKNLSKRTWRGGQEAIYTFHLPEGSVVTALSLWINGREEKAFLTTKAKAEIAYRQIVGVESRDPSLLHWQEGNTVSVRVFPVLAGETRKFKVGITSPLTRKDGNLSYENVYFDGPSFSSATENLVLDFEGNHVDLIHSASLELNKERFYRRSGKYNPDWNISFAEEKMTKNVFSFQGKVYAIKPYAVSRTPAHTTDVYFDINKSWTWEEFEKTYMVSKGLNRFVYDGKFIPLNDSNMQKIFNHLSGMQFSLFPFHQVRNPQTALLISKSTALSPNMHDLENSSFINGLNNMMTTHGKLRLFNLGDNLSPYMKALKEFRLFQYEHGDVALLNELLQRKYFAADIENDNTAVIDNAGITIVRSDGNTTSTAPDHLMRLFAYNDVIRKSAGRASSDSFITEELIREAKSAYVVTPISSLIVLETKKDYERFNIDKSKDSLDNASIKSNGAVPEPHEWALIILSVLVILSLAYKHKFKTIFLR